MYQVLKQAFQDNRKEFIAAIAILVSITMLYVVGSCLASCLEASGY
jgi:hypothetical protein